MGNRVEWALAHQIDIERVYRGAVVGENAVTDDIGLILNLGGSSVVIEGEPGDIRDALLNALFLVETSRPANFEVVFELNGGAARRTVPFTASGPVIAAALGESWLASIGEVGIVPADWPHDWTDAEVVDVRPLAVEADAR
jgi:hypothetical protein